MRITNKLDQAQWQTYFDHVSRRLEGKTVTIEVASLSLGVQSAASWVPLWGISYDPKDGAIAVIAEGLDHLIRRPREVYVETEGVRLLSMKVVDADGDSQILTFNEPLHVAAP